MSQSAELMHQQLISCSWIFSRSTGLHLPVLLPSAQQSLHPHSQRQPWALLRTPAGPGLPVEEGRSNVQVSQLACIADYNDMAERPWL